MGSGKLLPEFVTPNVDRHGKARLRFRRKGYPSGYFHEPLGSEAFWIEYRGFLSRSPAQPPEVAPRYTPGSIGNLVTQYCSPATRLGPTETTQNKVRRIVTGFSAAYGDLPVRGLTFRHIDEILSQKLIRSMAKTSQGMRPVGGPEAARKLRKELVRLFDFAIKCEMITVNPVSQADRVKVAPGQRSKGFHTWTEAEIAQYRARHDLGTNARLAMELMLWTDQRRIDSIHLGRQHIRDGVWDIRQSKTGKELVLPVAPQLLIAIVAMPPKLNGGMCFLLNEWGKPYTNASFGNKFREWCDEAGLPQCTAHGLRKATMRRMAELGMGNQTMKAVSGHSKDDEVALYTAAASQREMAKTAIEALSRWEMSNLAPRLDTATS